MHTFDNIMNQTAASIQNAFNEAGYISVGQVKDLDAMATVPGGKLCVGMECLDRDLWDYDRVAEQIGLIGMHRTRLQTGWQKTEQVRGVYDFTWLDNIVNKLLSTGVKPFLSLSYGNKLYCAHPENCPNLENGGVGHFPVETQEERDAWCAYVKATVEHFRDRIDEYEIFNEPDVAVFCCTEIPWPDAYMEMVKITAPVIRAAMPEATVITCTAGFERMQLLFDRGLGEYTDVHSFHGYLFFPEMRSVDYYRNQLAALRRAYPKLTFWRGEAGCPSYNDPISKGALSNVAVTEIKQAKFLLRHLLMDLQNDCISCTSYFHAYDFEHFTHKLRYHYGVIRHEDLSRKPSYHCLQMLTHLFDGGTVHRTEDNLTYGPACTGTLPPEQLPSIHFAAFQRRGVPFYTYHLPVEITDSFDVRTLTLSIPDGVKTPVVIDPFTRDVYTAADKLYPITDYPLVLMDAEAAREFADFTLCAGSAETADLRQQAHE